MFEHPRIAPSILSANFMNMSDDVAQIEQGGADFVHVDVMDGHFVGNITMGVPFVKQLKRITDMPLDVHLMISNPLRQLPWFLEWQPNMVSIHYEALDASRGEVDAAITLIHEAGCRAAIALKPDTPAHVIAPWVRPLDMVLVMSVYPGFSGQSYIEGSDAKVAEVARIAQSAGTQLLIEVDGGLGDNTPTSLVAAAGADVLVAGNAVFGSDNRGAAIEAMRSRALEAQQSRNAL